MNNKIVIVGAGVGGLTAAAYLAREGYEVTLLEKNNRIGGLLSTFESDGFFFDSGPRGFVNSGIVKPILKDLGIDGDFLSNLISIGIEDHIFSIDSMETLTDYQSVLEKLYPENLEDIKQIISKISELSEYTRVLYEFDNPNFGDVLKDKKYIFKKLIPWTFKFLYALRKMSQYNSPMNAFLRQYTDNQSLIDIITQMFFRKTPTHFALGYYYVYQDYFYPKGGTGILAELLEEKIRDHGAEIKLNTWIKEIIPSELKVIDAEGIEYSYDHLIWSADLKSLYQDLDTKGLDQNILSEIEKESNRISSAKPAESVFILFIGANRPASFFQENGGMHMFYTPSKKGLGEIHLGERKRLLDDFENRSKEEIFDWVASFLDRNTFEVSIPNLRDSSLAPEGKTGIMISCLFDYDLVEKIDNAGWYQELKDFMEDRIIELFSDSVYKGIAEDILFKFSSTPLTINQIAGTAEGAITGWSFETDIPVKNEIKDLPHAIKTAIPKTLKAGQWAYAPAGVPIAMLTGWYAFQNILKGSK